MGLMARMMWPKVGERIEVYERGKLLTAGLVTYISEASVTVQNAQMNITNLNVQTLADGLSDQSITIKKR